MLPIFLDTADVNAKITVIVERRNTVQSKMEAIKVFAAKTGLVSAIKIVLYEETSLQPSNALETYCAERDSAAESAVLL